MVVVPAVLLAGALAAGLVPGAVPAVERFAAQFTDHGAYAAWVLHAHRLALPVLPPSHVSASDYLYGAVSTLGALLVAGVGLFVGRTRQPQRTAVGRSVQVAADGLRALHSGHIGDYVAWWSVGASVIGGVCLLALR